MIEPIDPIDASFIAFDTPSTPQIIAGLVVLDGVPDIAAVRARIVEVVQRFPRLATRLQRSSPLGWLPEPSTAIDNHLTVRTFGHNPSIAELEEVSAKEITQPFAEHLSPWSVSVFIPDTSLLRNNPENELRSAFFLRIHHALGDGLAGGQIVLALTESVTAHTAQEATVAAPERSAKRSLNINPSAVLRLGSQLLASGTSGIFKCQNSTERTLITMDFDNHLLRRRKSRSAVTYNDTILELVSYALRLYANSSGQRPEEIKIVLPIALRLRRADRGALGNHLTGVIIKLPVTVSDREERIRIIHAQTHALKSNGTVAAFNFLAQLSARMPLALQRRMAKLYARQSHFICTNTPVATLPRTFAGAAVRSVYGFSALLAGHAIGMSFASYAGKTCVALNIDSASKVNAEILRESIQQSYLELVGEN